MSFQVFAYPVFQPAVRIISNITNANPAVVTTTFAAGQVNQGNQYVNNMVIRIDIPLQWGMWQMNGLFAPIKVIDSSNFSIAIDTTAFSPFVTPGSPTQYAQAVPIADSMDNTFPAPVQNVLPYPAT